MSGTRLAQDLKLNERPERTISSPSFWRSSLKRLWRIPSARIGGLIVLGLIAVAIFAPYLAPYDPYKMNMPERLQPPNAKHWFGTDDFGRDVFSRLVYGTRITLQIGFIAVGFSAVLGSTIGVLSGYLGGKFDLFCQRVIDIMLAFPGLLLAMAIVATLGPSLQNAMIAVGISGTWGFSRTVRSSVLAVKQEVFVEAARAQGASNLRIMFKHILPNVTAPIIVMVTMNFPATILSAASLSFIGLGAQPPTPEWGALLVGARVYLRAAPWLVNFVGFAIMLTVLAFNLLGNALRDVLDPRLKNT